ncbi:MAG TPA: protein kinase, partial [Kofleriaceae bacterium]|nr:protein kinase [Kofleriaceae bacterium]
MPARASVDSLGTMQMASGAVGAPPAMPAAPPAMPAGPPAMPQAAAVVAVGPLPRPGAPVPMPGARPSLLPTATAAATGGGPPAMPDPPVVTTLPTVAGPSLPANLPPAIPPARYQLGGEIARGGMGRVVDAMDTRLGRSVAFKEALTADSDALRRFEREIRITARLEHPSIVPVHDAGESRSGTPFYVMRKVSGRPLEKLVAAADTLGERLALIPHIVDSAQAIAHAHERGVVHRDIKPSNILVGELGETVVIDWGLAKVIGEPDDHDHATPRPLVDLDDTLKTRAGIVYGTPGFMAPEQLRGAPVDERCDVYALGATLYHLLARTPPHHAKTADEMMKAAVAAPPTPIRELVSGVPPDLSTIVDKALAHDPTTRYQDARALAADLQRFLTGQLVASHHYTPREKLIRLIRNNRGVSAAIAVLIVLGTAAVIRIYIERNRADRAAHVAETQRAEAERRAAEARAEAERAAAEAGAAAASGAERAEAIRIVAATVSVSSEPARVVDDLDLKDTKRERRFPAGVPAAAAARPAAVLEAVAGAVQDEVVAIASDAITAPVAAPGDADTAPIAAAGVPAQEPAAAADSTPTAVADEPSDGVIRHHIATAETAPVKRRHAALEPVDDDRPGDTTG